MGSKIRQIAAIAIMCATITPMFAQQFDWDDPRINWNWDNNRNTVTITAGYNSILGILTQSLFTFIYAAQNPDVDISQIKVQTNIPYGNYGLQYHYNTHKWFRVGAKFNADINKTTINDKAQYMSYFNIMASAQFTYYNENKWRIYSGLDIGINGLHVPQFNSFGVGFAFNLTPLGVSYGRGFIVFAELNLGYDAIAKAGFGLRL